MDWPTPNPIPLNEFNPTTLISTIPTLNNLSNNLGNLSTLNFSSPYGDAQFFEESISPCTVRQQLTLKGDPSNASTTLELLKGMKWLLANLSKGRNVSDFFSLVVKLVGVPNLEVRKLVYIYLARYANHNGECRELALLSINAFQRGLSEAEPLVRSLALRVLTVLDVPDVLQLQIMGVRSCVGDGSAYVRKCAVGALGKLYPRCLQLGDTTQAESLISLLAEVLAKETSTMVLTSAIIAFTEICPQRLELLHGSYRKICHLLTDMDEWGQVVVVELLVRYCRVYFKRPGVGSGERIDLERRVVRGGRQSGGGGGVSDAKNNRGSKDNGGEENLLSISKPVAPTTAAIPTNSNTPTATPTAAKTKKRRVVRKAFYSDEEDESSEEEVPFNFPTGGNIANSLRDHSIGGAGSIGGGIGGNVGGAGGFRDDTHANTTVAIGGAFEEEEDANLCEDHKLLLDSSLPLLKSRNSAVVLAVCSLHYYCGVGSVKIRTALGKALVRIHRDRREIQYVVLVSIRTLVLECPSAFTPFLNDFFVKGMDPSFTRTIKLDILTSLCIDPKAIDAVLSELRSYVRHNDKSFVCASIRAIGKIVELARVVYDRRATSGDLDSKKARLEANVIALNCLSGLVSLSEFSRNDLVVGECAEVMTRILAQLWSRDDEVGVVVKDPTKVQERALKRLFLILARALAADKEEEEDKSEKEKQLALRAVRVPDSAVASILWIVGEWSTMQDAAAPWSVDNLHKTKIRLEILRLLAKSFVEIDSKTKLQAVHLSSKVLLMLKADSSLSNQANKEQAICEFILSMGRVDVIQDVRDRSRYESHVLQLSIGLTYDTAALPTSGNTSNLLSLEKAKAMLLNRKPTASSLPLNGSETGSTENQDLFRFGTLSSIVGYKSGGSGQPLPKWADVDSPSSLRDVVSVPQHESEVTRRDGVAGTSSGLYSSSSSDDESSSDDSSSSSDDSGSESDDESSSDSSDESSQDNNGGVLNAFGTNGVNNVMNVPPPIMANAPVPSLLNNDSDESSSSSSSSDSDSSSESESDDLEDKINSRAVSGVTNAPAVGTILDMSTTAQPSQLSKQYSSQASNASSTVAAGLEGLVMTPLVVDKNDASKSSNASFESSAWKEYVRPELAGGLLVRMRFLRGQSRVNECKVMGLDPENPSTVCLQVHIENKRTDSGTLRHVRIVHRQGSSSGVIAPSRVIAPPEILALKKDKVSTVCLGITFTSATDKDGVSVAKFEVKSDRGSTPIEVRPTLGEFLDAAKTKSIGQDEFDRVVADMHGIHQRSTSTFSLSPLDEAAYENIPSIILQHFNLKQIGTWSGKGRFISTLPVSSLMVYALVECDSVTGHGDITVCCNNALASNSISTLLKQVLSSGK